MPKRTQTLAVFPWNGGLNTSLDEGLLQPGQLTAADNIVFDYEAAKVRREGINYNWDNTVFAPATRSSSGTSRTLVGTFTHTGIAVGDKITISKASNTAYNVSLGTVTVINATTLTYTAGSSLTEASTAETAASWTNGVVGGIDYWFGTNDSKSQYIITVLDNGAVYRTSNGQRNRIVDGGTPWTLTGTGLSEANLEVFNNRVIIAVSGVNNRMKYWDGNTSNSLRDLPANVALTSVSRASSGTTRTLVLSGNLTTINNGDSIIIESSNASYTGPFVLLSGSGTSTITYTAGSSLTEGTTADTTITVGKVAPFGLFLRAHLDKLWCNDKTQLDRLHYSETDSHLVWGGVGTSGAHDIGIGDGDPSGLTAIAPPFKGDLYVGKKTKLYRLIGQDADTVQIVKQSDAIGIVSHQSAIGVDQDGLVFCSDKGFHTLVSTNAYGAVNVKEISEDIQRSFVKSWNAARRRYIKAAHFPEINSVAFAVSEGTNSTHNAVWLFNTKLNYWYRWPKVECETLISAQDTDRRRAYFGNLNGRLAQSFSGLNVDKLATAATVTIPSKVSTGLIFPDQRPDMVKGFKRLMIVFKAAGSFSISAKIKIDNYPEQALAYVSNEQSVPLQSFVLGVDVLGSSSVIAPYSQPIDGFGRGCKITVEQNDLNTALAIQGFILEYEPGADSPETK